MRVISVAYFIGKPMRHFEVPHPSVTLSPTLGDDLAYDVAGASGPQGTAQIRMAGLYAALAQIVATGPPSITYAGDCLAVIGVLAGLQRTGVDPTLYWFDAHGDFHTWTTTSSNFLGGMPLAMLTGRGEQTIVDGAGLRPIDDSRIVLVDARDLDPGEDAAIAASGISVVSVDHVIHALPPKGPIYVHVDVDVVDPSDLPAINYPAPDGPTARSVTTAVATLARTGRVVAASVSTWNPAIEGADRAAATTRSIMEPFID
jgi:arginase